MSGCTLFCAACWLFPSVGCQHWLTSVANSFFDCSSECLPSVSPLLSLLGKFDEVYEALAHAHPNLTVYKKEELPERWRYKYNNRIQPIIAVADEGWYILQNKSDDFLCEYVTVFLLILHHCLLKWTLWIMQQLIYQLNNSLVSYVNSNIKIFGALKRINLLQVKHLLFWGHQTKNMQWPILLIRTIMFLRKT